MKYNVGFGFKMPRGGLRILGQTIIEAANEQVALAKARKQTAQHEGILWCVPMENYELHTGTNNPSTTS